ncbi:MAG: type II toxin-antitoxin system HicB family antitoxin [Bryobacteraceae bacterium]|nr:type II toxin-antitoxin system HicB family antitoxin [Bryobacteraceae bacterium]
MVEIQPIRVEIDRESDGRILASVPDLPGVMAYGVSEEEAIRKVKSIALQVLADMIESGEDVPRPPNGFRSPPTKTGKPAMHREGAQR